MCAHMCVERATWLSFFRYILFLGFFFEPGLLMLTDLGLTKWLPASSRDSWVLLLSAGIANLHCTHHGFMKLTQLIINTAQASVLKQFFSSLLLLLFCLLLIYLYFFLRQDFSAQPWLFCRGPAASASPVLGWKVCPRTACPQHYVSCNLLTAIYFDFLQFWYLLKEDWRMYWLVNLLNCTSSLNKQRNNLLPKMKYNILCLFKGQPLKG